ncbi:putative mob1 family protein [Phaeomoniella chlamydospora]|uniref:Putative mob1 family protein n=1 Tax=Phaeomoniella chlamydospora TaxID=158046 RepID=A0A0G2GBF6_PHACM|nr:putative mob1 family protein [Phaeomoniella chlamydospora]
MRYLTNIFRRVYRIFAHAWFQHRGVFWEVEGHDGLYVFFKTVCDAYALIGEDNYTIPAEAEGHEVSLQTPISNSAPEQPMILKKNDPQSDNRNGTDSSRLSVPDQEPTTISTGATTRRHKHTPSTGTNVTTIAEGEEEESNERPDEQEVSSTATAPVEDESKELVENAASLGDGVANISSEAEPIKTDETDATADDEHKEAAETPMEPSLQNEYAQAEATTKEVLEQKVEDPLQEGSGNLADVEKREETGPAPIDAVS